MNSVECKDCALPIFISSDRGCYAPTVEEGLDDVTEILDKQRIFFQDVDRISAIYQAIDSAERNHRYNQSISNLILQRVIFKIYQIIENFNEYRLDRSDRIISFYYLKSFVEKYTSLSLQNTFEELKQAVPTQELAFHFPFCQPLELVERDAIALRVDKNEYWQNRFLTERDKTDQFLTRKQELGELQRKDPAIYSPYLNKILKMGYIDLYDYLIEVKRAQSEEMSSTKIVESIQKKMSCEKAASLIIETRDVIVEKVMSVIDKIPHQNKVFFLIGATKAGKSTALCFLRGDTIIFEKSQYISTSDKKQTIGENDWISSTLLPNVEIVGDLVLIDFPGFSDTHGPLISLGIKLAIHQLIKELGELITTSEQKLVPLFTNVHFLLITPFVVDKAGASLRTLNGNLKNLIENVENSCAVGLTKYAQNSDYRELKKLQHNQEKNIKKIVVLQEEIDALTSSSEDFGKQFREKREEKLNQLKQKQLTRQSKIEMLTIQIEETEKRFLSLTGIDHFVAFRELEKNNPFYVYEDLVNFSLDSICPRQHIKFNPEEKALLNSLFKDKLAQSQCFKNGDFIHRKLPLLVLKHGLIPTLFSKNTAAVFQILNPEIQLEYEKFIFECMLNTKITIVFKIIESMFSLIEKKYQDNLFEELKRNKENIQSILSKYTPVENIDIEMPVKNIDCHKIVDRISNSISELLEIGVMIEKKEQIFCLIAEIFTSSSVEEFKSSARRNIEKIKKLYGEEEWNITISSVKERAQKILTEIKSYLTMHKSESNRCVYICSIYYLLYNDINPNSMDFFSIIFFSEFKNLNSFILYFTHEILPKSMKIYKYSLLTRVMLAEYLVAEFDKNRLW